MATRTRIALAVVTCLVGSPDSPTAGPILPDVSTAYLVPSDRAFNPDYLSAIEAALVDLQGWYADQLGGATFTLSTPSVQTFHTSHPASYYATNPMYHFSTWFFDNVVSEGFARTGGKYDDPNHRWVYYIDAEALPGQFSGAAKLGVSVISGQDLRGLTGQEPFPVGRWIGGLGHELGHTFGLPHHANCSPVWLTTCPADSLMWLGFYDYPNTYFLPEEKDELLMSPFITAPSVFEPATGTLVAVGLVALSIGRRRKRRGTPTTTP